MKSTRPLAIALLSIVPFTAVSTAQAAPATGPSVQQAASVARPADASSEGAGYADTILQDVNDLRTQLGLQPVTRYTQLDSVAQTWSEQMASQDTMSHNPSFADQFPGGWSAASENVAMRTGSGSTDIGSQLFEGVSRPLRQYDRDRCQLHRHRHRLQLVDGLLVRHPELRRLFRPGFDGSGSDRPVLELE